MLWSLALFGFFVASTQGRAVNISNTWVLPEEGFPVFYRYFRDRISWYEADAVCQFHHANLVTVDTTAQYDAVRAYLKELDISSAVWVGLIRSNPDGDFTWTDYRGLSGDGYWSSAPDPRSAPLCAAADPAADYRWEARACGGPTVASFICELPVPQWALGNVGCMVKALPALTVLYLPESAAVQLTADCGLAGVKRVQCTGNVKREELLKDLSCAEEDEPTSTPLLSTGTNSPLSSENAFTDPETITETTSEENATTEHEDDINQSSTIISTPLPNKKKENSDKNINFKQIINKSNSIYTNKDIDLDTNTYNNLQSNDIPKLASNDNFLSSDLSDKFEDEKHMQHKLIHDEIARHGNFETIFTQPTDHFVPPLVMAKAKMSDDMTVLSVEEKHAQQLAEQRYNKHFQNQHEDSSLHSTTILPKTTRYTKNKTASTDKTLISTKSKINTNENVKKDVLKTAVPKKYDGNQFALKSKNFKVMDQKSSIQQKNTEVYSSSTSSDNVDTTTSKYPKKNLKTSKSEDEPTIDLTVIIKEPESQNSAKLSFNQIPKIEIIQNDTSITKPQIKLISPEDDDREITQEISVKLPTKSLNNFTMTHEVIKITILKEENSSDPPIVFEVTTKLPTFKDEDYETTSQSAPKDILAKTTNNDILSPKTSSVVNLETTPTNIFTTPEDDNVTTSKLELEQKEFALKNITVPHYVYGTLLTTKETVLPTDISPTASDKDLNQEIMSTTTSISPIKDMDEYKTEMHPDQGNFESNLTDTSDINDFQSPLLSGANEPLHKPNRSRRPQSPNRITKFNPFRILG